MNILFIGNEDIVGKYGAERLFKEGHHIYWLTNREHGMLWGKKVKGKIYRNCFEEEQWESIFKAHSIDTMIFMTGSHRDRLDHQMEENYTTILLELTESLKMASKYNIQQFVFLSSIELVQNEKLTPVLTDLKVGEQFCKSWGKNFDLNVLILRLGSVYGIDSYKRLGYTGYIIQQMISKKNISINKNEQDYIDILDASDSADAIYRALIKRKCGTYTLTTGMPIRFKEYVQILQQIYHYEQPITFNPAQQVVKRDIFDSLLIKKELVWMPHDFEEHGKKILEKVKDFNRMSRAARNKKNRKEDNNKSKSHKLMWTLENVVLFLLTSILLNFTKDYSDFRFIDVRLVYIVIIACIYGSRQAIIAIALSCTAYSYSLVNAGIDISYLLYSIESWTPFMLYIITGAVVGYVFDKKEDNLLNIHLEYKEIGRRYEFLKNLYKEVCEIKDQLQKQIVVSKESFGRVYEITKELDTFEPELIFYKAVSILENVMECDSVCLYIVNPKNIIYARLMASSANLVGHIQSSLKLDELPELKQAIENKQVFVNRALKADYPVYAAPILNQDQVIAIAIINAIDFEKYTIYYQNLFQIIIGLIQNNLVKAYTYNTNIDTKDYIESTRFYKAEVFKKRLETIERAKGQINLSYLKAKVKLLHGDKRDVTQLSNKVTKVLRSTDFAGCDERGNYYVVLMQTNLKYADKIKERFTKEELLFELEA